MTTGIGLEVSQSRTHVANYTNSQNQMFVGSMRYTGSNMQVFDGNHWIDIDDNYNVRFTQETQSVLTWAREKMRQEQFLESMKDDPVFYDLLKQKKDIEEKLLIMTTLIDEKKDGSDGVGP